MATSTAPESLHQVHYTADSVHRGVDAVVSRDQDLQQSITQMRTQLLDIATTFQDLGAEDKVAGMRERYKDLLALDNEVSIHMQALQSLKTSYKPSADTSDFSHIIQTKLDALSRSQRFDPERSQEMKNFDKETGQGGNVGNDDDIEEVGGSGLRNDKCPLSAKSVFDLLSPVADRVGIIYEKVSIMEHLRRHARNGESVKCPMQGTTHTVSERELRPAMQLERAKRRKKVQEAMGSRAQTQGQEQPATTVFDADE